ncbi:MAG: orotate phosphoribosyltransferase [Elusimicrobiota bacterium]
MNSDELKGIFRDAGALLSGHFKLSSGRHSGQYFQCALVLSDTRTARLLGEELAALLPREWGRPETVVGPALGGVIIGHETARALNARSIFTERKDGKMSLRRGFAVRPGEKVLIVEDVVTTGKSSGETAARLREHGAVVIGILGIVQRGAEDPELGLPVRCLAHLPAVSYEEADCPLCAKGIPVVKPGSRTKETPC